jgi:type I restriction enzyme, S subunit
MNISMNDFAERPLSDLVAIEIGRTPSRARRAYWGGRQDWVTISDFSHGETISRTKERISEQAIKECGVRVHAAGTLVMSFKLTIGKIAFLGSAMATNEAIAALKPIDENRIDTKYLFHYLSRYDFDILVDRAAKGRTLNKAKIRTIPIRFPRKLDEQRRIANILDKADAIRCKREQTLLAHDALARSAFIMKFGDPAVNPHNLPLVPIKDLGRVVTGNTPPRKDASNYGSEIEWIKSDNINTPSHYLTKAKESLSASGKKIARIAPAGSTLVTCIAGSPSVIGNAALSDREVAFNQQINAVIPAKKTDPLFLYCQFLVGKRSIQVASTNSMKGMVSKGKFQEIMFMKPKFSKQEEFGVFFQKILSSINNCRASYQDSQSLFDSLAYRAFRGEV